MPSASQIKTKEQLFYFLLKLFPGSHLEYQEYNETNAPELTRVPGERVYGNGPDDALIDISIEISYPEGTPMPKPQDFANSVFTLENYFDPDFTRFYFVPTGLFIYNLNY